MIRNEAQVKIIISDADFHGKQILTIGTTQSSLLLASLIWNSVILN